MISASGKENTGESNTGNYIHSLEVPFTSAHISLAKNMVSCNFRGDSSVIQQKPIEL